jgi:hypothetical protein
LLFEYLLSIDMLDLEIISSKSGKYAPITVFIVQQWLILFKQYLTRKALEPSKVERFGRSTLTSEGSSNSLLEKMKQLSSRIGRKKRIFLLSWLVVIPLMLSGVFLFMQPGSDAPEDENDLPVTEFDHPGPQVYHFSPADFPDENCSECHESDVPDKACIDCHNPPDNITRNYGGTEYNISFPHHGPNPPYPATYTCEHSSCHNAADSRAITEVNATHEYCDNCHDLKHERNPSSSSSARIDIIIFPILTAPITIALVLFRL